MEKKKRSKCATSHRKVFTVNEANPKEKIIFDFLSTLYNESDIIKDILYDYIISNDLQTAQHSVNIVPIMGKHSVSNNAVTCNEGVNNSTDNFQGIEEIDITDSKNDFSINLDEIEDDEINMHYNKEEEIKQANDNALEFLKNSF